MSTPFVVALFALVALRPPMPRHSSPFNLQFALGWLINEQPFLALWWLLAGTLGTLIPARSGVLWWVVAGLGAVDLLLLARIAIRTRSARPVLSAALVDAFGPEAVPRSTRPAWWRILLLPVVAWRPDVRRIRNRRYGPARAHRLDVYVSRRPRHRHHDHRRTGAPVLVYLHGGSFGLGTKMMGARPLLYRLAAEGWVVVSAGYRTARAGYADQLADVRAALAWTREHAASLGGRPGTLFLAGGSFGAHLAATAALTDDGLTGVIALYGYYGAAGWEEDGPSSPLALAHPGAPPFLVVHGALDTLVLREDARTFVDRLRAVSEQPVGYAELPGTQHNFDFFHSLRCHRVNDAIARFTEITASRAQDESGRDTTPGGRSAIRSGRR
jgi:acetyl esterase/lipase